MAPRSVRFCVRSRKFSNVRWSDKDDDKEGTLRHISLVPAAFAVVITHQIALGTRGGQ
jgi:hypothetical protein